jgi:hypothetical protein
LSGTLRSGRRGLVFTHENFAFRADGSLEAWAGKPSSCVEILSLSPEIPGFTMEKRLRVIDALLEWSDRLHKQQGEAPWKASSAVELAERLYEDAVSRASSYLSGAGEYDSIAISEEVHAARARAIWHPHPDDPPQN